MNTNLFEFYCPVKIISGALAMSSLPYEMRSAGVSRAMVVTDAGVKGAGLISILENAFDGSGCDIGCIFDETPPDSAHTTVNKVAQLYRDNKCDCFVAVGGGSCIDTAKAANIVISEETDDLMKFRGADRLTKPTRPLFVAPTTAGTGSEVTLVAVINNTDAGVKMAFTSPRLCPTAAFIDPRMTLTCPPKITAATGMDALTHAIEAFYCLQKNPVSDSFALSAISLIMRSLVKCVENGKDEQARLDMANAALVAGIAFSNSMVGVVHALAHATGGVCHVPHGVANAILLPYGMENNLDMRADVIAELAPHLCGKPVEGSAAQRARAAIDAVRAISAKLNTLCGLPLKLSDAGVTQDKLETIANAAVNDGALTYNPENVTAADALRILKQAF
jgi:alcohol dehydrogenase